MCACRSVFTGRGRRHQPLAGWVQQSADIRLATATEIRREILGKDFAASAAITVAGFAVPEMMIEIQGVAVPE